MPGHIQFAESPLNRTDSASPNRGRATAEKGSAQRSLSPGSEIVYPTGWRLILTTTGLLIGFFLSNLDVTIVSSSLTSITDNLNGFEKRSWIVTGYLATYTGSMAIWTKVSDIIGRKIATLASLLILLGFSIGCGCAQTVNQLIVFRALQGIGGAGAYALAILCLYEIAPKTKLPFYSALMSICIALASLIGPIVGGALAQASQWRWVFLINAPLCAIAIIIILFVMPKHFGLDQHTPSFRTRASYRSFANLDLVGSFLALAGSFLIVTVLNEANLAFAWKARGSVALLVLTGVAWIFFFAWEWHISSVAGQDPIFPKRWVFDLPWMGLIISSFVTGAVWNVVLVYVPQQAQILLNKSPLDSGIYLIGYSAVAAVSAAIVNIASSRGRIPFIYSLLVGCVIHTVGVGLLSTITNSAGFHSTDIAYEVISGAGIGITMGVLLLATPYVVEDRDLAIATGTIVQFRFLGGAIGLAISSNILNGRLAHHLKAILPPGAPPQTLHFILENSNFMEGLSPPIQNAVKQVFADSYSTQLKVMIGFAVAQLPAVLLLIKPRHQIAANKVFPASNPA